MIKTLLTSLSAILALNGAQIQPEYHPKSVVVLEVESGEIFYEENMHEKIELASTSKLMSVYVALKEIESGKVKMDDQFTVTSDIVEIASLSGMHQMIVGKNYTLEELIQLNLIPSSNAAAVMLAKSLYGNESNFVDKMNEYAKLLNMTNTSFINSSGLDNDETKSITNNNLEGESISSAYDMALMTRELITKFPNIIEYTKQKETRISKNSLYPENLISTYQLFLNKSDKYVGLKTGTGVKGGYNFIALANHNHKNYIVLLFGVGRFLSDSSVRYDLADNLMKYAFEATEEIILFEKGEHHLENVDFEISEPFKVSSNRSPYEVKLDGDKLRFTQFGKYLDGDKKEVEKEIKILRLYEYGRAPFQYLGLEIGLISFIIYQKRKRYKQYYAKR